MHSACLVPPRTVVNLVAGQALARAEAADLALDTPLLGRRPGELRLPLGQRGQELRNESAQRLVQFRGPNPCPAVAARADAKAPKNVPFWVLLRLLGN